MSALPIVEAGAGAAAKNITAKAINKKCFMRNFNPLIDVLTKKPAHWPDNYIYALCLDLSCPKQGGAHPDESGPLFYGHLKIAAHAH